MKSRLWAEQFSDPLAHHAEGPVWDTRQGVLLWVDMLAGRVLRTARDGTTSAVEVPDPVAAIVRPRAGGGHAVVGERTLWHTDLAVDEPQWLVAIELPVPQGCRSNDGGCAPDGTFYVGTMAYDSTPGAGQVLAVLPDGSVRTSLSGTTISNGLQAVGTGVVFVDSPTRRIVEYQVDRDHRWHDPTVLVQTGEGNPIPDGMCMDAHGGIWVAMWDAGEVRRYAADGKLSHTVLLPVSRPTACALGGDGMRTLYITTSKYGCEAGTDPVAGSVFAVDVELPGMAVELAA